MEKTLTAPDFTSHNIELPGGAETRPGTPLLTDTGICKAALRTLAVAFSGWAPQAVHVADLGCLEGGYTVAFHRAGYQAAGVEVRPANYARCQWVARQLGDPPGLTFVKADARRYLDGRWWDAVFCSGLLYHLEHPRDFIYALGKATRRCLILNTHYAAEPGTTHRGDAGTWYEEHDTPWGGWGNKRAFWLAKPDLIRLLAAAGFTAVYEQVDYFNNGLGYVDHHGRPYTDRVMLVALKT